MNNFLSGDKRQKCKYIGILISRVLFTIEALFFFLWRFICSTRIYILKTTRQKWRNERRDLEKEINKIFSRNDNAIMYKTDNLKILDFHYVHLTNKFLKLCLFFHKFTKLKIKVCDIYLNLKPFLIFY